MKTNPTQTQSHHKKLSRRKFVLTGGAAAAAFTIVPRHVLGGPGFVAPSEKITLAYIGCGTQGLREMLAMLAMPDVQIVAVCDPVKDGHDYVDWSKDGLRASIAGALGKPDWRRGAPGIPGGRDVAREIVETSYANQRQSEKFNGCTAYVDFRELLEKEKDLNAIKVMTPDHLHATVAVAAMNQGKHVLMHKPLANRLHEARLVIETARKTKVATHFLPASNGGPVRAIKAWIDAGAIGTLRAIHNWSNRRCGLNTRRSRTILPPSRKGLTGNYGWGRRWTGPIIQTTPTPCSAAGMSSAAARWPTWGIIASGPSSNFSSWTLPSRWNRGPAIFARVPATSPFA